MYLDGETTEIGFSTLVQISFLFGQGYGHGHISHCESWLSATDESQIATPPKVVLEQLKEKSASILNMQC